MTQQENRCGCPTAGSAKSYPRRKRRLRGRRPRRKNRTVGRKRGALNNVLICLFAMIQLATPSTAAPTILPPLAVNPTHWAVTPNLPMFQLVTWSHEALPLVVSGNVSIITGGSGKPLAIVERRYNKTLSWHAWTQPICVFLNETHNETDNFCFPFSHLEVDQTPHPSDHPGWLWLHLSAITHVGANCSGTSPLPPCSASSSVFAPLASCSTGRCRQGPTKNATVISFWDGAVQPTLVAPVPVPQPGRPQTHLWKIGLALNYTTVVVGNFSNIPPHLNHSDIWNKIFSSPHGHFDGTPNTEQGRLTGTVQTGYNSMFLLCPPRNLTITYVEGYNVSCSSPVMTNTLNSSHVNFTIFLLRIPPYTVHPVKADPFAFSPTDEVLNKLLRRKREGLGLSDILSVVNLALNILEEVQIIRLQKQLAFVASTLQNFMVQSGLAWKHQEQIDRLLFSELQTLKEVLEVVVQQQALLIRYMRLQCHYKYYPVCVTPIPYNASQYAQLERLLKDANTATNFTTELHMLDEVIEAIQNATMQFSNDWEKDYNNARDWWDALSIHQLLQWVSIGGIFLILAFLFCLCLPCLTSCILGVLCRSLEAVKADVIKQKGGVVRGALDPGPPRG
ncbi:P2X purinoceptor 4 isoform X2 [Trichosurus vulpecula]|nr:P2X purinoceptor 4 isoform X2 [Trichosurus vulpecula]